MIDSHCHLDHEFLDKNLDEIIFRAKEVGIEKLLTISTNFSSFQRILQILDKDQMIYGTFGIHPHETENNQTTIEIIKKNVLLNKKIIGIGETGLDFFYNNSNKNSQIESFEKHINSSIDLNFPLIVHSRNAEKETFEILNNFRNKNLKILMHCFTGSYEFAKKLLKLNAFFSASGIITFKNSKNLQETFKKIPQDNLLIETDSPFLAPVPFRGKKNEPSYIKHTASKLAELKNLDFITLSNITTKNFKTLFLL